MRIFWRVILPFILASILAAGLTLAALTERSRVWLPGRTWWLHRGYLYVAAGIFIVALITSLAKTLRWGKEAEEYAIRLKEEKADELKRHSDDV